MARAKAKMKTKDIDRGYKSFVESVGKLKGKYLHVGFLEGDMAYKRVVKGKTKRIVKTNTSIASIAALNEFGTDRIPSRPFMARTWNKNQKEAGKRIKAELKAVLLGRKDIKLSLNQLGLWYQSKMVSEIQNGRFKANSPITVKRKGSTKPLIDTGRMWQSVKYIVKSVNK